MQPLPQTVPAEGAPPFKPRRVREPGAAFTAYALLLLVGIYLDVGYRISGVPMLSALPGLAIGLAIFARRLLTGPTLWGVALCFGVYLWSVPAVESGTFFMTRTVAFAQFLFSLIAGLILFWTVTSYSRRSVVRFIDIFLLFYLGLIVLEVFTPFSRVVDAAQQEFYGQTSEAIAGVLNRDANIGLGLRRPKVFLSETSYAAMAFTLALGLRAFLAADRRATLRMVLLSLIGIVLIRSPISVVGLIFVLFGWGIAVGRRVDVALRVIMMVVVGVVIVAALLILQAYVFGARTAAAQSGVDYSTTFRTYGSLAAAWAVAREHPVLGVGIGSIDVAYTTVTQTFLMLGLSRAVVEAEWRSQIQNLPAALILYLGVVGAILFSALAIAYYRYISGRLNHFFWLFTILLGATYAAFYAPKFQTFMFLFAAANRIYNRPEGLLTTPRRAASRRGLPLQLPTQESRSGGE